MTRRGFLETLSVEYEKNNNAPLSVRGLELLAIVFGCTAFTLEDDLKFIEALEREDEDGWYWRAKTPKQHRRITQELMQRPDLRKSWHSSLSYLLGTSSRRGGYLARTRRADSELGPSLRALAQRYVEPSPRSTKKAKKRR